MKKWGYRVREAPCASLNHTTTREAILWGTGAAMPQMSEVSWAPLAGFYPVSCFSCILFQQCEGCTLWAAEPMSDIQTPCLTCCCLLPKAALTDELGSSSWRSPACILLPETQRSWISLTFLSHCWMWENWPMCFGERAVHWTAA